MWRTVIPMLMALSVLGLAIGCGEAGDQMTKNLQTRLDGMDLGPLKAKAESAGADVKAKAMELLTQLEAKKAEALELVNKLKSGEASTELMGKAKDAAKGAQKLMDELKKLLGM